MPIPVSRLRPRLDRVRTGLQGHTHAPSIADGIRRVADLLHSLAGTDEAESRFVGGMKDEIGAGEGEVVQDVMLFLAHLADGIADDVDDGAVSVAEVTSTLFEQLGRVADLVDDVTALKK